MDGGLADHFAALLLRQFGIAVDVKANADHPAIGWRRSGLMALTGHADGPGLVAPVPLTALADGAMAAIRALGGSDGLPENGALLLGERARLNGLGRQGMMSPNGSCRLIRARDGLIALNMPRVDDWDLAGAMLGEAVDGWDMLSALAAERTCDELLERGRLLGLAIARDEMTDPPSSPFRIDGTGGSNSRSRQPLVVDFSALWAGPLAGSLLALSGAQVVKVESSSRPDGARLGNRSFFDLLNGNKEHIVFDFANPDDLARLRRLVGQADIVIEGTRPRALRQLEIDAEAEVARGASWISITAHGRHGAMASHAGFGDDAAVAGGMVSAMRAGWGEAFFAGDAIADPLTGLLAAFAGLACWRTGGGRLVSLVLADTVAFARHFGVASPPRLRQWQALAEADDAPLYPLRSA